LLAEIRNVRQTGGRRRRWFQSEHEDLIVWYSDDGSIWGFQLCYDRGRQERAFTWRADHGYAHERVDDGEAPGFDYKRTPILVQDGAFDAAELLRTFLNASAAVPKTIVDFVAERITKYPDDDRADS